MFEKPTDIKEEGRVEKIATHGGWFHADEVFATAILKDLFPETMELKEGGEITYVEYTRERNKKFLSEMKKDPEVMLVDVGTEYDPDNFNLDHHQIGGAGKREDGIEYAASGLVWKHYGKEWIKYIDVYHRKLELSGEEIDMIWSQIDKEYIEFFDSNDTGQMAEITYQMTSGQELKGNQFTIPEIVRLARIDTHDGRSMDDKFKGMVELFRSINLSLIHKYMNIVEALRSFDIEQCEFSADRKTVLIDSPIDPDVANHVVWNDSRFKEVEFYATLSPMGWYNITAAIAGPGQRTFRNPQKIPKKLRLGNDTGKIHERLGIKSGVRFIHTEGYMAQTDTKEAALKILNESTK